MELMLARKLSELEVNDLEKLLEDLRRADRDAYNTLKELIDDLI
jgi:hypothetical protein